MPSAPSTPRYWLLGGGALLGLLAALITPSNSGCVYPDTCIKVTSAGTDWCRNVALAKRWPVGGSFEDAEPILRPDGAAPRGCRCYNDAELQIFADEAPQCKLEAFDDELEQAARQACQALVPPGYDHNCWTSSGPQESIVEDRFQGGPGACIGNCEYGAPPAGGSCPTPSPYECATGGDDGSCDTEGDTETDIGETSLDETGSDTSGGVLLDIDELVSCNGYDCEIDEAFARGIYADPSPLVDEGTLLIYDPKLRRHVLHGVAPDSLVYALGLRNRDQLESIEGIIIHDLESALRAYVQLVDAPGVQVQVKRGTQWLDFTYTFVP